MLLRGTGVIIDIELQSVVHHRQLVVAPLQPDPVGLKTVPKPRLGDPLAGFKLGDQVQLLVE